jgi:hypothetical protein
MAKKYKLIKNITVDKLATMMNNSFESQTKLIVDGFSKVDEKFDKVFKTLKVMDDKLDEVGSVRHEVDYIETALNIQPIKKH